MGVGVSCYAAAGSAADGVVPSHHDAFQRRVPSGQSERNSVQVGGQCALLGPHRWRIPARESPYASPQSVPSRLGSPVLDDVMAAQVGRGDLELSGLRQHTDLSNLKKDSRKIELRAELLTYFS